MCMFPAEVEQGDALYSGLIPTEMTRGWGRVGPEAPGSGPVGQGLSPTSDSC